jgi:hypothetical protein
MTSISNFPTRTTSVTRGVATDGIDLRPGTNQLGKASLPETPTKKPWNTFEPLDPKIAVKIKHMSPAVHEKASDQLRIAHAKIAELEQKLKQATNVTTPLNATSAAPAAHGKLKKMAGAIKNAFEKAPWKTIGKGALYATVAVATLALISNPLGALGMVAMIMGSSMLPTALGLAGAGAAVYKTHKWLEQKPAQTSNTESAATGNVQNSSHPSNNGVFA